MRQPTDRFHPEAGFVELEPLVVVGLDLVWVVVGAVAVAILFAFWLVLYVLNAILGRVSFFGFHPFTFALDLVSAGMKKALGLLDSKAYALGETIFGIMMTVWRFVYVVTITVASLAWRELAHFQQLVGGLFSETNRARASEQGIQGNLAQQVGAVNALIQANAASTQTQLQTLVNQENLQLQSLQHYIQTNINALEQQIQALHVPDLSGLQTQINNLGTNLQNQINTDISTVNATINRDVTDLVQQINGGVATAEQFATGLVGGLGIGGIVQTLTALQGQVSKIATETTECLDPLCATVTPNAKRLGHLGNLLKGLEDLAVEAIIMALAAECLTDPKAVVNDISTVVNGIGDGVMAGFRDLVGA